MLATLLRAIVRKGTLTVVRPGGTDVFGSGTPRVTMKLHDSKALWELALNPDLKFGELYMEGRLTVEDGDIADLLDLLLANLEQIPPSGLYRFGRTIRRLFRFFAQYNPAGRAKSNVAHHYDLSGALYDLFLDKDRQYSCAYFSEPDEPLDDAQIGKKRHIAAKLYLDKPGLKVLDIGSGWGGLALDLARDCEADVLGVTLSEEQIAIAKERSAKAGLDGICRFALQDYRSLDDAFDRIVSVGMFEHVGVPHYPAFFEKVSDLLKPDGVALLHTIGRVDGPGASNPWITKYIFPGGYTPALSEMLPVIEASGLIVTDVEVLRLHYAHTLKAWHRRFRAQWQAAAALYDERFCRMWDFYLTAMEASFRRQGLVVFQLQMAKRIDTLPITRDYMFEAERTMKFAGTQQMPRRRRVA
jgi:cyclopropane-fatty-acyl-phospholipid synthase